MYHSKEHHSMHNTLTPSISNNDNITNNKPRCFSPINNTLNTNNPLNEINVSHTFYQDNGNGNGVNGLNEINEVDNYDSDSLDSSESLESFDSSNIPENEDNYFNQCKSHPLPSSFLKITGITFELKDIQIDLPFLKKHLRTIPVRAKKVLNQNKHFRTLIELQNFYIDNSSIWVIKFSLNGKYLATGSKRGILKIFEVINYEYENFQYEYNDKNILSYMNFLNEKPKQIMTDHNGDIIDLAWSYHVRSIILIYYRITTNY